MTVGVVAVIALLSKAELLHGEVARNGRVWIVIDVLVVRDRVVEKEKSKGQ